MTRKEELLQAVGNDITLIPLVEEVVYLETELDRLRELPKIKIHPTDPSRQKATPAAKLYKEFLQQYTNVIKILIRATGADDTEVESPLRKWMNAHVNN